MNLRSLASLTPPCINCHLLQGGDVEAGLPVISFDHSLGVYPVLGIPVALVNGIGIVKVGLHNLQAQNQLVVHASVCCD